MKALLRRLRDTARLMVGQPNYDTYRAHMAKHHPDQPPMSRADFFRERERARFGAGGGRGCC